MENPTRKKSSSSESDLSDSWSLVDSPDCVELLSSTKDGRFSPTDPCDSVTNRIQTEETSDAESVEIIQEDPDVHDFVVKKVLPESLINRTTFLYNGGVEGAWDRVTAVVSGRPHQSAALFLLALITLVFSVLSLQVFLSAANNYESPVEEVSALVAELAYLKEENFRLNYQLGVCQRGCKTQTRDDQNINNEGLEKIVEFESSKSKHGGSRGEFDMAVGKNWEESRGRFALELSAYKEKLAGVTAWLGEARGLPAASSARDSLNRIDSNLRHLALLLDNFFRQPRVDKVTDKLTKFFFKVEQDFVRLVDKLSLRVNKIHRDFVGKLCLTGNSSLVNCTEFKGKDASAVPDVLKNLPKFVVESFKNSPELKPSITNEVFQYEDILRDHRRLKRSDLKGGNGRKNEQISPSGKNKQKRHQMKHSFKINTDQTKSSDSKNDSGVKSNKKHKEFRSNNLYNSVDSKIPFDFTLEAHSRISESDSKSRIQHTSHHNDKIMADHIIEKYSSKNEPDKDSKNLNPNHHPGKSDSKKTMHNSKEKKTTRKLPRSLEAERKSHKKKISRSPENLDHAQEVKDFEKQIHRLSNTKDPKTESHQKVKSNLKHFKNPKYEGRKFHSEQKENNTEGDVPGAKSKKSETAEQWNKKEKKEKKVNPLKTVSSEFEAFELKENTSDSEVYTENFVNEERSGERYPHLGKRSYKGRDKVRDDDMKDMRWERNSSVGDGEWFVAMGEGRRERRAAQRRSDWLFDRTRSRSRRRDPTAWVFDRASLRQFCRENSFSSFCLPLADPLHL